MINVEELIKKLGLEPLQPEGGFFKETYRSKIKIGNSELSSEYSGERSIATAIYYLITPNTFSTLHRLKSDELYFYHLGDPLEVLLLYSGGKGERLRLGNDIENGSLCQLLVPKGVWQGLRLKDGGEYALLSTVVSPGFEFSDFESANDLSLASGYPEFADLIKSLIIY